MRHRLFQGRLASGLNPYGCLLSREDFLQKLIFVIKDVNIVHRGVR